MTNDTSYEHYRRDEAEVIERLDEQRRAADAAAQWGEDSAVHACPGIPRRVRIQPGRPSQIPD
jgi:hypothetical protein